MLYAEEIKQAAESYEIAEAMNGIREFNKKAEMIYQEHFNKAKIKMNNIAEDFEIEYAEVLKSVRAIVKQHQN